MLKTKRVSKQRLQELRQDITAKDLAILETIRACHYLTGQQIVRLYFRKGTEIQTAELYASYRCLKRLGGYGLIRALQRRIGGVRAGSGSYVWALTAVGFRMLRLNQSDRPAHEQFREPSLHFL